MAHGVNGGAGPDDHEASAPAPVPVQAIPKVAIPAAPIAPAPITAAPITDELAVRAAEVLRAAEVAAAATGRAMVAEARGVRRRMLEDADRRRRELVVELERVRTMIDDAIAALRADETADQAPGSAPGSAPAQVPDWSPGLGDGRGDEEVGALFARLRSEPTLAKAERTPAPKPKLSPADTEALDGAAPEPEPEAEPDPEPDPEPEDVDDGSRRRRASVLEPLVPSVVRASKRLLQDEQNSLLDAARRVRGRPEPGRVLPDLEHQRDAWMEVLRTGVDGAYLSGRAEVGKTGRVTKAPARVVAELVGVIITPLRERLAATIERVVADGPYDSSAELQRVLGSAIGARYREWKSVDLETQVLDALCAAYARGSYDGAGPAAPLRWVPNDPGRCPDCDDNSLEPTAKGGVFPTGQTHPPAHPGCRCLILLTRI